MAFMLVIVPRPLGDRAEDHLTWGSFWTSMGAKTLSESEGVFSIGENAWIFDTRTALPLYGRVIHVAHKSQIQLHVFPIDAETVLAHGASYPKSEKLEEFLSS